MTRKKNPPPKKAKAGQKKKVAKRAPRKKKAAPVKRTPVKKKAGRPKRTKEEQEHLQTLCAEALRLYVYTLGRNISIREIADREQFKEAGVTINTLEYWSGRDSWVAKRQAFRQDLQLKERQLYTTRLIEERAKDYQRLDAVVEQLYTRVVPEAPEPLMNADGTPMLDDDGNPMFKPTPFIPEPRSLEGVVGGLVKVMQQKEELRDAITTEVLPETMRQTAPDDENAPHPTANLPRVELNREEIRAGAKAIMAERRRQRLALKSPDAGE